MIRYLTLFAIMVLTAAHDAHAQTMDSSSYKIRMGNFNITSGLKSSTSYSLTDTVGQTAAALFASAGYTAKVGFQYIYTLDQFSFRISDLSVELGSLTPNTFSTATNTLTVSAPGQGYSVSAFESTRLKRIGTNTFIPDTACDSGPCTESAATVWTTPTNNGFGYNASGNDVAADFVGSTYFRPFPDSSAAENPATVMTTSSAGLNRVATITYKVSPGGAQAAGEYENQIVFIATPTF